jgi:hypothetical protein
MGFIFVCSDVVSYGRNKIKLLPGCWLKFKSKMTVILLLKVSTSVFFAWRCAGEFMEFFTIVKLAHHTMRERRSRREEIHFMMAGEKIYRSLKFNNKKARIKRVQKVGRGGENVYDSRREP